MPTIWHTKDKTKLLILKISTFLCLSLAISAFANSTVYSQIEISVNAEKNTITEILDNIESSSELRFFYDNDIYDFNQKISIKFENKKINQAIGLIFKNNVGYRLVDNVVILEKKKIINKVIEEKTEEEEEEEEEEVLQTIVQGTVTDKDGNPLPGATVIESGTDNGTTSDFDGKFSLAVSDENATLEISFIGFKSQQIVASINESMDIQLIASVSGLDDVVVVGYGSQNARDLTSAISKIKIDDAQVKSTSNVQNMMYGKAAGVQVTAESGEPGAGIEIRIRGVGTTGNNMPLYVIDGVPIVTSPTPIGTYVLNPLSGLSSNDIESIEILKDASSSAIYGARASNGVVIITTKRGKGATETKFTYDTSIGFQNMAKSYDMLNVSQYIDMQKDLGNDYSQFSGKPTIDGQGIAAQDNAPMVNHSLNISGGTEQMNFSIMGNYFSQDAFTDLQGRFERYSLRANSDIKVGERLKFGESLQLQRTTRNEPQDGMYLVYKSALNAPFVPYYDANGPGGYAVVNNTTTGGAGFQNWFAFNDNRYQTTDKEVYKVFGNFYAEVDIIKGLKFRSSYGVEFMDFTGGELMSPFNISTQEGSLPQANLAYSDVNSLSATFNNIITYETSFGKHDIKLLAGHEETNYNQEQLGVNSVNLTNRGVLLASTAQSANVSDDKNHWAIRGFLGRMNYSFDGKYYLTANLRQDSSSRFSSENRTELFPSFSGAWRISDESFMDDLDFINDLKIRASFGTVGNQNTGANFAYIPTLGLSPHYVVGTGQTPVRAPVPYFFANPGLRWETSEQIDIGFDAFLFDGALSATFDYYKKTTKDLLVTVPIPATSGFLPDALVNAGVVENSGLELSLTYFKKVTQDFSYNISANITSINNEVIDLAGSEIITGLGAPGSHRTIAGYSIGHFFGHQTDGIFQSQAEVDAHATQAGAAPGDVRFKDIAGPGGTGPDGVVDTNDRTFLGSPIPDLFYGLSINANYKNFDFSISGQGVSGREVLNLVRMLGTEYYGPGPGDNLSTTVLNRWTGAGTSNYMPRAIANGGANANNRVSDMYIEDGSFFRLRNLQVGYSLPKNTLTSFTGDFVDSARVYFSGQNLLLITDYSGLDPEVTRGFSYDKGEKPLANGEDGGRTPQPRILQFGLQITF